MNVSQLTAALVLRVGRQDFIPGLIWQDLGPLLDLTQDQIRHRLTNFKKKYNLVDDDAKKPGFARSFLAQNTPESEKDNLEDVQFFPGEVVYYESYDDTYPAVVIDVANDDGDEVYTIVYYEEDTGSYHTEELVDSDELVPVDEIPQDKPVVVKAAPAVKAAPVKKIEDLQHLITPNCLIVVRDGKPLTIDKSHKNFDKIEAALKSKSWNTVLDLIDMKNTVTKYSNGRVKVEGGLVTLDGQKVYGKLVERLVDSLMTENSEALEALANFMVKCDDNPDNRVVTRIFDFISATDIRLDKDGDFYAYKVVRNTYLDKHSNTMDNSPGKTVKMKRNQVNPNDAETCSFGLHACSKSYITHFSSNSDRVVLVKINPRDVVSVPSDYGDAKLRCCEYQVMKDVTENFMVTDEGIEVSRPQ